MINTFMAMPFLAVILILEPVLHAPGTSAFLHGASLSEMERKFKKRCHAYGPRPQQGLAKINRSGRMAASHRG
jgi:hypothetical protein